MKNAGPAHNPMCEGLASMRILNDAPVEARAAVSALRSHHHRLFSIVVALGLLVSVTTPSGSEASGPTPAPAWPAGAKILFQGDSITAADRGTENAPDAGLGHGYVYLVAVRLTADDPARRLVFGNRGVSGNRIHDLAARWQEETIALRPEILSILVGFNDTAAEVPLDEFEATYDRLLEHTKAELPNVKLVLCEPFALLPPEANGRPNIWETDVRERARIVERLATKYGAAFVPFQKVFDAARKRAPTGHWLYDGIHPTHAGHQLMADEWIRATSSFYR